MYFVALEIQKEKKEPSRYGKRAGSNLEGNLNSYGQVSKQLKKNRVEQVMKKIGAPLIPKGNNPLLDLTTLFFLTCYSSGCLTVVSASMPNSRHNNETKY